MGDTRLPTGDRISHDGDRRARQKSLSEDTTSSSIESAQCIGANHISLSRGTRNEQYGANESQWEAAHY